MLHSSGSGIGLPAYPPHTDFVFAQPKGGRQLRRPQVWGGTPGKGRFQPSKEMDVTARATSMPISIVARACRRRNAAALAGRWLAAWGRTVISPHAVPALVSRYSKGPVVCQRIEEARTADALLVDLPLS
jgi:hypothetical protein